MITRQEAPPTSDLKRARLAPTRRWGAMADVIPVVLVAGFLVALFADASKLFLLTTAAIYVLFALSTNVLFGWAGMASFGQAAFFGAGGYAVALLRNQEFSPLVLLLIAGIVGLVFALVFGVVAVRTSGVEFAMLTLVFAQVLYLLTYRIDALRGEDGIPGIRRGSLFGLDLGSQTTFWWFVVVVVGISALALRRIRQSSLGASFSAVRDDPLRAAALGVPVRIVRVVAFSLAGAFGGVAGGLFALQQGLVSPVVLFWALSGNVIVMCLVGGLHHFWGPAVGAVTFTVLNWYLFDQTESPRLYIGLAFLVIVIVLPGGLASLPRLAWDRLRRRGSRTS